MEEDGDIYDGAPAQFPISFGKQSKPQTPLEAIHTATRRSNSNPKTANDLPSISSSSRECLLVDHDFKFLVNVFQLKRYTLILPNELDAKFT